MLVCWQLIVICIGLDRTKSSFASQVYQVSPLTLYLDGQNSVGICALKMEVYYLLLCSQC